MNFDNCNKSQQRWQKRRCVMLVDTLSTITCAILWCIITHIIPSNAFSIVPRTCWSNGRSCTGIRTNNNRGEIMLLYQQNDKRRITKQNPQLSKSTLSSLDNTSTPYLRYLTQEETDKSPTTSSSTYSYYYQNDPAINNNNVGSSSSADDNNKNNLNTGPFPTMPSQTFFLLANSQFELLANSLHWQQQNNDDNQQQIQQERKSKIKSIALYLPQENPNTGQLEFLPSAVYPSHTATERVFIASDADSGLPPTMPATLTKLPGFTHAQSLIPTYPFAKSSSSSSSSGASGSPPATGSIGIPEEVMCDVSSASTKDNNGGGGGGSGVGAALSLPLFLGSQTIGVLLVWPSIHPNDDQSNDDNDNLMESTWNNYDSTTWTTQDKEQISRAGETIALALSMDTERYQNQIQRENLQVALADSLHQVKNPIQAMRTFTKLLQRNIAMDYNGSSSPSSSMPQLLALAENMMMESDRVVDLLLPFDSIVQSLHDDTVETNPYQSQQQQQQPPSQLQLKQQRERQQQNSNRRPLLLAPKEEKHLILRQPQQQQSPSSSLQKQPSKRQNESRKIKLEMAFVADILSSVIFTSEAIALDRGIQFETFGLGDDSDLPGVSVCPKLLKEAVVNVIDNAIKYVVVGDRRGTKKRNNEKVDDDKHDHDDGDEMNMNMNLNPRIRITFLPYHEGDRPGVTIYIEDNGPGIDKSERKLVFSRGYRSKTTETIEGTGIGLDISKTIIEEMGGSLEIIDNVEGHLKGTVIQIRLFR